MDTIKDLDIQALAKAIAANMPPPISADIELWTARQVAAYLKRSPRQIVDRYANLEGFPAAVRLPAMGGGRAKPLWPAKDIIAWAMKYQVRAA